MSLINVRNFLAPFQNKYQIGALLVIALVIAVVRIIGSTEPPTTRQNLKINDEIKEFLASQEPSTQAKQNHRESTTSLDEELLGGNLKDEPTNRAPAPDTSKSAKGLSDIKRSLGLE